MKVQENRCDAKVKLNLRHLHLQFCLIASRYIYNIAVTELIYTVSWRENK